jgi:glycerate dehydrogenase
MKIVVLDGHTLNPGDLSWASLAALGELTVYDRTPPAQVLERAGGAAIVLTNKTVLARDHFESLPELRYVGVLATGYNVVDVKAAVARGIVVTNVPTYGTDSVAQLVFAHLLHACHRVADHARGVRDGKWCACADFCYHDFPLVELAGLTMGLIGFGRIGRATGRLAQAFGMQVMAYDSAAGAPPADGVIFAGLDELLRSSDVVSLHCPLTPATERMLDAAALGKMKRTAFLVNTSRGGLIDEAALAAALNAGTIAGAGLDVLSVEPPRQDNPLLGARNVCITPHLAWATVAARRRLLATAVSNVRAFLAGRPTNVAA